MDTASLLLLFITSLVLGLSSGFIMHRSDYCIAGMFRDLFLFRHTVMIKTLLLLVVSTMVLFELARFSGLLPIYPFPLLYAPTPVNFLGGILFGLGMVLAGGCVVGTLYKMGAGSFLSAITFVGLVLGSAFYAEFHSLWASLIKVTTFLEGRITLAQTLGVQPLWPVIIVSLAGFYLLGRWRRDGSLVQESVPDGYLQPWKAAIMLSIISLVSYVLIGMPMGVTSSYAKLAGYAEKFLLGAHVDGLAFFQAVPLTYVQPLTKATLTGGGGPVFDAIAAIQFPLVSGIVLGSTLSAVLLREFRIVFRAPMRQYASALVGGIIMGLASRMAPTCNVWHLMGGLPVLATSSVLFLLGLFPGAWLGSRLLVSLVMRGRGA